MSIKYDREKRLKPGTLIYFNGGSGYVRVIVSHNEDGDARVYGYIPRDGTFGFFEYAVLYAGDADILVVPYEG